jgi:hypothetical protein
VAAAAAAGSHPHDRALHWFPLLEAKRGAPIQQVRAVSTYAGMKRRLGV